VVVTALAMAVALAVALAWRSAWAPAAGALAGVAIALAGGAAEAPDLERAARELWRPLIVIGGVMVTSACASELGVFTQLAAWIEPRTRGPVRRGFGTVFALSALVAALLSNDAAILMFTPVVIELIRTLYPKRNPQLLVPFAFAVFVAAGVAPLPTGNPMNLVVADRAGIDLNTYAVHMIPVAVVGWVVAYAMLRRFYRSVLDDEKPALGGRMRTADPVGRETKIVLLITAGSILSYPILAGLGVRIWVVAGPAALACALVAQRGGVPVTAILRGVSWELFPFVFGVLVLATAASRAGATEQLSHLYHATPAPLPTVGVVAAAGSALINNHPMALLHSIALADAPHRLVYAALVGGDLGPRLLPIGSLAGLLWLHALRRRGISISLGEFVRVGLYVTIPSLAASLATLWLVTL
jgi:arsenical pump membrane protein